MNNNSFNGRLGNQDEVADSTTDVAILLTGRSERRKVISRMIFKDHFWIKDLQTSAEILFENCQFQLEGQENCMEIHALKGNTVWFSDCTFKGNVSLEGIENRALWFNGCIFEKKVSIKNSVGNTDFRINESQKTKSILHGDWSFVNCHWDSLIIRDVICEAKINFHPCGLQNIFFGDGVYDEICFHNYRNLKSLVLRGTFEDRAGLTVGKITAPYLGLDGNIWFQNIGIRELDFSPFNQNGGSFKIQNVAFSKKMIIKDSDLGRILFNEVDFSDAQICLDNSYIGDCIFSNIRWPKHGRVFTYSEINRADFEPNLRDTLILKEAYRQLKNITKSQSSNIDALNFYRNEMLEYWHEIQIDPKVSIWEKFIVWASKASSNFGLSLKRPFWLLVAFHGLLFVLIVGQGYDGMNLSFDYYDADQVSKGFGNFFALINPVHKYIETPNGWVLVIDFFMRMFSGFFAYHIIRATRKHAKL